MNEWDAEEELSDTERELAELEREYDGINMGFRIASEKLEAIVDLCLNAPNANYQSEINAILVNPNAIPEEYEGFLNDLWEVLQGSTGEATQ